MYEDEFIIGHGKQLNYAVDASGVPSSGWTRVHDTIEINLPERELGESEITNDESPNFHQDFQPGLYNPGTITFKYNYSDTQFAALETVFALATVAATRPQAIKWWQVVLPNGARASVRGYLKKHDLPLNQEDTAVVEGEIRCKGPMTYAPAP